LLQPGPGNPSVPTPCNSTLVIGFPTRFGKRATPATETLHLRGVSSRRYPRPMFTPGGVPLRLRPQKTPRGSIAHLQTAPGGPIPVFGPTGTRGVETSSSRLALAAPLTGAPASCGKLRVSVSGGGGRWVVPSPVTGDGRRSNNDVGLHPSNHAPGHAGRARRRRSTPDLRRPSCPSGFLTIRRSRAVQRGVRVNELIIESVLLYGLILRRRRQRDSPSNGPTPRNALHRATAPRSAGQRPRRMIHLRPRRVAPE
jgi:hypothetical protein